MSNKELELQANNPTFRPVELNARDPLPYPELNRRVSAAMAEAEQKHYELKHSERHLEWYPTTMNKDIQQARRDAIKAFNEEMAQNSAEDHHS